MRKWMYIVCSLTMVVAFIGCRPKANDTAIEKDIESKVATDSATQDSKVVVESKQGNVKLTGKVKNPAAQQKVAKIAKDEAGVAAVDNETHGRS